MHRILVLLMLPLLQAVAFAQSEDSDDSNAKAAWTDRSEENYLVHPDSIVQPDVPQGELLQGRFAESKVFPGTERDYWIYLPAQYDASEPTAVMIFQDGANSIRRDRGFRVPTVFDNLIARKEMPVTIGVFINPGVVPAANENAQPRYNRSYEYDSVDDRYSRFLVDEFLPAIAQRHGLNLTSDPNRRAICGSSSGGICAFVAAWHRPDQFRRVFTTVGTYVGLRGGHELATLVRKTEPKPLRVFLQDGSNDLNIYAGDWWMANQTMLRSLQWAGYEINHAFGQGFHGGKHGAAILPDVLRWLWNGESPAPVQTHVAESSSEANRFLVEDAGWEVVSEGHQWAEGLAATDDGTLYFTDVHASKLYRVTPKGEVQCVVEDTGRTNGIALGPDGRLYGAASGAQQIRAWDLDDFQMEVICEGTHSNDIVVRHDGTIYYTDPADSKIWMVDPQTKQRTVADHFKECNGLTLSADQSQLFVAHFPSRFIYAFTIHDDGSLTHKQPMFHLEVPSNELKGYLDGMCSTSEGWLVATSKSGVQICDPPGRVHLILPMPSNSNRPCYVELGGPDRQTLYVANVDKVYKRKSKMIGAPAWKAPVTPPKPRL